MDPTQASHNDAPKRHILTVVPEHPDYEDQDIFSIPCPRCTRPIFFILVGRESSMDGCTLHISIHAEMVEEHHCPHPEPQAAPELIQEAA